MLLLLCGRFSYVVIEPYKFYLDCSFHLQRQVHCMSSGLGMAHSLSWESCHCVCIWLSGKTKGAKVVYFCLMLKMTSVTSAGISYFLICLCMHYGFFGQILNHTCMLTSPSGFAFFFNIGISQGVYILHLPVSLFCCLK